MCSSGSMVCCTNRARASWYWMPERPASELADAMPTQQSSTAQDLARGRRSEIDQLNGWLVRRGEALGVPTPVNRTLHGLVKLLEDPPGEPPLA